MNKVLGILTLLNCSLYAMEPGGHPTQAEDGNKIEDSVERNPNPGVDQTAEPLGSNPIDPLSVVTEKDLESISNILDSYIIREIHHMCLIEQLREEYKEIQARLDTALKPAREGATNVVRHMSAGMNQQPMTYGNSVRQLTQESNRDRDLILKGMEQRRLQFLQEKSQLKRPVHSQKMIQELEREMEKQEERDKSILDQKRAKLNNTLTSIMQGFTTHIAEIDEHQVIQNIEEQTLIKIEQEMKTTDARAIEIDKEIDETHDTLLYIRDRLLLVDEHDHPSKREINGKIEKVRLLTKWAEDGNQELAEYARPINTVVKILLKSKQREKKE